MKKLKVLRVVQHDKVRYVGKAPAKEFVRLATKAELQATQEAQRPITKKRLEEIASFVSQSGLLSTSIVIGSRNDLLTPFQNAGDDPDLFYIHFPETEEEFEKFRDSFDIMDGQHRLFSFLPEYIKISDLDTFEISFELYVKPVMRTRRLIFKNTNEKQEKVSSNLLMWFREKLEMLTGKEATYHGVVTLLNSEICSPLRGRIIMGAERITGGFKAQQVITILDKADVKNIAQQPLEDDKLLQLITVYLEGWENAVGAKIADRDRDLGAFSKISGLRFMILLLPHFYDQAAKNRDKITASYIENKIRELFNTYGMEPRDLFDKNSKFNKAQMGNPFSAETPITILAKDWANKLKSMSSGNFDPLA